MRHSWPCSSRHWRGLPECAICLYPFAVRHTPVGPHGEEAATAGSRCDLGLVTRLKSLKNVQGGVRRYPNCSCGGATRTCDIRHDEPGARNRPGGPTTEIGPMDR